ncbi:hypothetical protein MTO96_032280 [Rhipicephalus appendiculatus]
MVAHIKHFLDFLNVPADSLNIQFKEQVPTVKVDSGIELTGCAPIGRYIAEQSEKGRAVLGKNAQERALIQQWLEYVAVRSENGPLSLHPVVSSLTFKDKEKYGHLCRWFDLVQHQEGLRQNLPLVVFSKTRLYV